MKLNLFFLKLLKKKIFHFENKKVVIINVAAVQIQRCITTSIYPMKSINLKYITPIKPHQKDPSDVSKSPLLNCLFILIWY